MVIAIIAILAAMLLPALQRAKLAAKTTQCASTLHHLGLGLAMYCDDNNGMLPPDNYDMNPGSAGWGIDRAIHQVLYGSGGNPYPWGVYGAKKGIGHVLAGGYLGGWRNIVATWEPTYPNGQGGPPQTCEGNRNTWIDWSQNPPPSGVVVLASYDYRGWIPVGSPSIDADVPSPRIDAMRQRAALWCRMLDWDTGGFAVAGFLYTHPNGFNVLRYDGSVWFFPDPNGRTASTYVYFCDSAGFIRDYLDK